MSKKNKHKKGKGKDKLVYTKNPGKFSKRDRKEIEHNEEKLRKKKEAALKAMRLRCNHNDRDGARMLYELKPGVLKCSLCKMQIIDDPDVVNGEEINKAYDVINSAIALIRNKKRLSSKAEESLISSLETIKYVADAIDVVNAEWAKGGKDKGDKKHKGDKHKNKHKDNRFNDFEKKKKNY